MTAPRLVQAPAFSVCGRRYHVPGQDTQAFVRIWQDAHESGLAARLKALAVRDGVTGSELLGVSLVAADPSVRTFDFLVAAECDECAEGLETAVIPAATWAIFDAAGELPGGLVAAEMEAMLRWLPASGRRHDAAPEMEVYDASGKAAFWLPVTGVSPK